MLAEYRWMGFTLSLNANYIPEMLNAVSADPETVDQSTLAVIDSYFQVDGRLSYTFKGRTTAGAPVVADGKDAKGMVDAKGAAPSVAGPEVMSPIQRLLDGTTVTVGCNNMFGRTPPFVEGANSATDLSVYDPYGQFVYFELSKKF